MGPAEPARPLAVTVAYSGSARQVDRVALSLPAGATVGDALRQSGLIERHSEIEVASAKIGVWGKLRSLTDVLRDGDRVEVYRPLKVDPKEARRQRYRSHRDKVSAKR
jgi:putative ubiquitin-RnfH superfamily antitoxin RatB of RatAB toxin-antitoxin module